MSNRLFRCFQCCRLLLISLVLSIPIQPYLTQYHILTLFATSVIAIILFLISDICVEVIYRHLLYQLRSIVQDTASISSSTGLAFVWTSNTRCILVVVSHDLLQMKAIVTYVDRLTQQHINRVIISSTYRKLEEELLSTVKSYYQEGLLR